MAHCLCSSALYSAARHEQGRSPHWSSTANQVKVHSEARSQKHQGRMAFLLQLNPSIACRSCVQSLGERLQFSAASQGQGSSGAGARGSAMGGKELEMLLRLLSTEFNPCLPSMVYFKEIQPHVSYFLPGLIDQPLKSRRRDSRSGYPPRLFQQGAEAGSDVTVYKLNQPFLSALLHLACSVHPGHQPVLLSSTQRASGQQTWGWEHWECGLWLCSLSWGWNTSIPCLHL